MLPPWRKSLAIKKSRVPVWSDVIGQTESSLDVADAGIEPTSIPASGPTVNVPPLFNLTVDETERNASQP